MNLDVVFNVSLEKKMNLIDEDLNILLEIRNKTNQNWLRNNQIKVEYKGNNSFFKDKIEVIQTEKTKFTLIPISNWNPVSKIILNLYCNNVLVQKSPLHLGMRKIKFFYVL